MHSDMGLMGSEKSWSELETGSEDGVAHVDWNLEDGVFFIRGHRCAFNRLLIALFDGSGIA